MQTELQKITEHWAIAYSTKLTGTESFQLSEEFKRLIALTTPGNSYSYIVNLKDMSLEYISNSASVFIGKAASEIQMQDLMQNILPSEIEKIKLKSQVISGFYNKFLQGNEGLDYKNIFSYRMKDAAGTVRTMLYQAIPLSLSQAGTPAHVLCIQTDVSHLKITGSNAVSFLHINGGPSYFNVDSTGGSFDPANCDTGNFAELFTERERQIIHKFTLGRNARQIAEEMHLSAHTVKTHRRNILQKSGCNNTTELVAKCLSCGIISPGLN
ncbi:response regulator transcription factor [Salegentibacter sp. HM20]